MQTRLGVPTVDPASSKKKRKENGFFLRTHLTVDLFEGPWLAGSLSSPLTSALGPQLKLAMTPSCLFSMILNIGHSSRHATSIRG